MIRDLGPFTPKRPQKLEPPILAMLLNAVHDRHEGRVFVLQVGAGTGRGGLPLLPRFQDEGWSGLLIEPLPQHFAQLEALHADSDRVAILNLGISDISASLMLHALTPEADSRYRRGPRGRASLIRDRIAQPGVAEDEVQSVEVPFLRMDTVLDELGIDSAQLVAINAGGHEAQVLAGFDLATLDPSLVFVHATPATASEASCLAAFTAAGLIPFQVAGWLIGLAPGRLAIPLEELLTFFNKGVGAPQDDDE
ncbi:MAG: FkbM family methyltransferase [Tabrizicola sp.]|jgi:FkbM family methyltransferase|nr:FkbM family methyltransferase [Tabrizicola sp.]